MSTNNGADWSRQNEGLLNLINFSLAANDTYIFTGTMGNGVWRRPLSRISWYS